MLAAGTRIGSYEIIAKLGEGGMGAVYRARDSRLNREVAIKVLLPEVAGTPDRVARFTREAQLLATLNHPNIAAIIGIEEHTDAGPCIVMELVPGRDLADLIKAGPVPLSDALAIARQIAEALEAAHEAGLVHRDLKPANVKVRDDGTVKILDFGLAKAVESGSAIREPGATAEIANSPTLTPAAQTQPGLIVGTVAYMSPEQAKAQRVDKRTDIWAFGVILHEMLTGRHPFRAETMSEVLAAVLTRPVDVSDLPAGTPQRLRTLIRRCLSRDQKQRLRDIGDARLVIDEILAGTPDTEPSAITPAPVPEPAWRRLAPWSIAAIAIVAATMIAWRGPVAPATGSRVVTRTATTMPTYTLFVTLSPDGKNLAFSNVIGGSGFSILLRPLDRLEARPIAGTEDGRMPVFSPDGRSIVFFTLRNGGTIRRVSITGDDAIDVGPGIFPNGAAWGDDNTIVFAGLDGGLMRVAANGGKPEPLTTLDADSRAHTRPQFLSNNRILFTIRRKSGRVEFAVLEDGVTRVITGGGDNGRFIASGPGDGIGHLVFGRDETLFAIPFDINRLVPLGDEAMVVERVSRNGPLWNSDYTVSADGLLVYSRALADDEVSLGWTTQSGEVSTIDIPTLIARPRLSPDGRRAAGQLAADNERFDIAVVDLARGTTTRVTGSGSNSSPIWTPDGRRIVFSGVLDKKAGVYVTEADGSSTPRLLFAPESAAYPVAITPDGRTLVYTEKLRLWQRALDGSGEARPLHESPVGDEVDARVSPDGNWIAYVAVEGGRGEVYVHEFPGPGRRERVSTNGALTARWIENGRGIAYWDPVGQTGNMNVMKVPVQTTPALQLGTPSLLFSQVAPVYDVNADGSRFLGFVVKGGRPSTLVLVTNWFDELRAKAPFSR